MWSNIGGSSYDPPNKEVLNKLGEESGVLTFNGEPVANGGGGGGAAKKILGGTVKFSVDFIEKTISFTTWNLWTESSTLTLAAGSKSFPELGNATFHFVCYRANTIELVTVAAMASYTGFPIFGVMGTEVHPFGYPVNQIGVRGGRFYNRPDLSVGEWTLIGDSLTQGNSWWQYVREQYHIPVIHNLAVAGKRMSGATGMWRDKDTVSSSSNLITIMGGTNDEGGGVTRGSLQPVGSTFDTNTFMGAYQTLIEGLQSRIPAARIVLLTPPRAWTNSSATVPRTGLKLYGDDVKEIGAAYNLPVVDMYNVMGYNELNQSHYLIDGLHWSEAGQRRVAAVVCGALRQYIG